MRRWLILCLLCLLSFAAQAEVAIPPLTARVTDLTNTLSPEQRAALESRLQEFETKKGSQIAVLIVPTTQPEDIAQYSIRVVEQWKLGRKKVDDGVLLLVAKDDHKLRIEVGYGLEGVLPDVIAKRIIAEIISPRFKQGDFFGGISAGAEKIISVIDGEPLPVPQKLNSTKDYVSDTVKDYFMWIVIGSMLSGLVLRIVLGVFPGGLANGVLVGTVLLLLGAGALAALIFGVVVFFVTASAFRENSRSGGFSTGGFGSGGEFSGGDFGGGGFSGGGGGFGGGGASGDW